MNIDSLEKELCELEQGEVMDRLFQELEFSDTRRAIYLQRVAEKNNLRIVWWPKIILIPESHFDPESGVLVNEERMYKNGIYKKWYFWGAISSFIYNHSPRYVRKLYWLMRVKIYEYFDKRKVSNLDLNVDTSLAKVDKI